MAEESQIENNLELQASDINVAAFMEEPTPAPASEDSAVGNVQGTSTESVNSDDDNYMSWSDINADRNPGEEFIKDEVTQEVVSEEPKKETIQPQAETKTISVEDAYNVLREELGFNANNIKELKIQLQELEKENEELKQLKHNNIENDKISKLSQFRNLSDEALLMESFKRQGFSDEEARNAVDRYIDNQMIDIEAKKIRKGIDSAIERERNNFVQTSQQEEARLRKEREESIESLKQYMNGVDTMYGLKIAKDNEGIEQTRKEHLKYITSGKFLNEVTENNENLVEASWLWKNREIITKSFYNKGKNEERAEFMNELQNPDISNGSDRIKGPDDDSGFNPSKFISINN